MAMPYRDNMPFTIDQIVRILGLPIKKQRNAELILDCPFCLGAKGQPDHHGHLSVDLRHDRYRCHRCGRMGGKLQLYMECKPGVTDTKQAYREIMEYLGGSCKDGYARHIPIPISLPPSVETERRASPEQLHETYTVLIGILTLTSTHRKSLHERGLPDAEIDRLQYRSIPAVGQHKLANRLLQAGCALEGVPGFYLDDQERWTLNTGQSGIIMPERDAGGRIHGLQVRKDQVQKQKCYWITGAERKKGCPQTCIIHFAEPLAAEKYGVAYLTEGLMKADVAAYFSGRCFIAVPGTSHFSKLTAAVPLLKMRGVHTVVMAFDMDMYVNPAVMEDFEFAKEILSDGGLEVKQLTWDRRHKGIDDYLKWQKVDMKSLSEEEDPYVSEIQP